MIDYHVLSMNLDGSDVTVHPVALSVDDVEWAESKFWAPDAAFKNGKYYLYYPAKDKTIYSNWVWLLVIVGGISLLTNL